MAGVVDAPPSQLFRTIACRELWGSWQSRREIRKGELFAIGPNVCEGIAKDAAYDSMNFQSLTPITYFHGPFDPTTTTAQAEYHLRHQPRAARQFVTVPNASHGSLTLGLAGRKCSRAVWETLDKNPEGLATALQTCTKSGEPPVDLRNVSAE